MERLAGRQATAVPLNAVVFAAVHLFAYGPNLGYLVPVFLLGLAVASLRAPIYEEKVVDFLLELVKVTERKVPREELYKEEDEDKPA